MKYEVNHWYKYRRLGGAIILGRYIGRDPEECCNIIGHRTEIYNVHVFEVYYKQHGEIIKEHDMYCDEHLPDIVEELGDSNEIKIFQDLDD